MNTNTLQDAYKYTHEKYLMEYYNHDTIYNTYNDNYISISLHDIYSCFKKLCYKYHILQYDSNKIINYIETHQKGILNELNIYYKGTVEHKLLTEHFRTLSTIQDNKIKYIDDSIRFTNKYYGIQGEVDLILENTDTGERYICEIKSQQQEHYKIQLQAYLIFADTIHSKYKTITNIGYLIYYNPGKFYNNLKDIKFEEVAVEQNTANHIINKTNTLTKLLHGEDVILNNNILEYMNNNNINEQIPAYNWECEYCIYNKAGICKCIA